MRGFRSGRLLTKRERREEISRKFWQHARRTLGTLPLHLLAAFLLVAVLTFPWELASSRFFTLRGYYPSSSGGTEASPTSGGNLSYGFAGTAANDASDGDTAWTNPGNAGPSDDSLATVALNNNESQWLKITNFDLGGPISSIPAGASINGIEFHIECSTSTMVPTLVALAIVKGGAIGSALTPGDHTHSTVIGTSYRRGLLIGSPSELFGDTFSVSDMGSGFGIAIRVSSTGTETVSVDGIRVNVRWAKASAASISLDHASSPMAKTFIGFDCLQSYVGDSSWEKVGCHWSISGPAGWSEYVTTDPRPGSWGSSRSRSMKTDFWGYNGAIYADAEGTYTITATLHLKSGGIKRELTAQASVAVAADTRAVRYLDPGNGDDADDGTTSGLAWNTWAKAVSELNTLGSDARLVVAGDTTETVSTAVSARTLDGLSNVVIEWDGVGAKPIITAAANTVETLGFGDLVDFVIDGIDLRGSTGGARDTIEVSGDSSRILLANLEAQQGHRSFMEKPSSYYWRGALVWNCDIADNKRYGFYFEGMRDRLCSVIGTALTSSSTIAPTGEALIRVGSHYDSTGLGGSVGFGWSFAWLDLSANGQDHAGIRCPSSFVHVFQCAYGDSVFNTWSAPDNQKIYLAGVRVFNGVHHSVDDESTQVTFPERLPYTMLRNSVFLTSKTGEAYFQGSVLPTHLRDYTISNCYFATTNASGIHLFLRVNDALNEPGWATAARIRIANNSTLAEGTSYNTGLYDNPDQNGGSGSILENGGAFVNNGCAPAAASADGSWTVDGDTYNDPATVNALDTVSGAFVPTMDVGGAAVRPSDLPSSRSFAPTSGDSTNYEEGAEPEDGVWIDYEGTLRDHDAPTWAVGPTIIS